MEVESFPETIYEDWGKYEILDNLQESTLEENMRQGNDSMVPLIVKNLSDLSQSLREKSITESQLALEALKQGLIFDADKHITKAVKAEWRGAAVLMQSNRLNFSYWRERENNRLYPNHEDKWKRSRYNPYHRC